MTLNPSIFREYDIRGVADRDMPDDVITDIGRAIGTLLGRRGAKCIVLGRDCRLSSPRIHDALEGGIRETGMSIVDIGMVPTPLMYFAVFHLNLDGGVQITGSHNPAPDNGLKLMEGKATLFGEDIRTLRSMVQAKDFDLRGRGTRETRDMLPAYVGTMRGNLQLGSTRVRFAIDAGNGAGGPAALAAMRALGLDPIAMNCEPDGQFPAHHPDPTEPENLQALIRRVREEGLDVGIAYDGDADRLGVIDARGDIVWGDRILIAFARGLLRTRPGAAILGEVKCSQTLYDDIAKHGGRPILWKTGHSLIKAKMKEEGALLAGEMSGHLFFADRYYGFDDAIYASLRLVELLSHGASMESLLAGVPVTHSTPEIRVDCADEAKFDVVKKVLDHFRVTHDVIDVDGARILFEGGWGLVRASNTQPVLVLRFEAENRERLAAIRDEVETFLRSARG